MLVISIAAILSGTSAYLHDEKDTELSEHGCEIKELHKKGLRVRASRPPLGDATVIPEGLELSVECSDNFIDNMFDKRATRATCLCKQTSNNETICGVETKAENFRCISKDVCPLPQWQGARTHTVKEVDDDWALLSFKLRKNRAMSKQLDEDFSWSEYIPKNQNWTIVLACPFNVLGVEYDNDPEKDDLQEMIDEGVRMMKDCRGDHMMRASMQRNSQRRLRKEKKMARLARKAAREGRHARRNGDFTDKLCQLVKDDDKYSQRMGNGKDHHEHEIDDKCPCDRKTWRGRKYMGRISSLDGRVTSSSHDGRMWTIVSKGEGGVNNGSREFKIAIDMLNGVNPLKWKTTREMKSKKKGMGSANQYTCELGIVTGHYPHLAPCLNKFHQDDIYRHMKDFLYMKKNSLLPTENPYTKPTGKDPEGYGKPGPSKETGKPGPSNETGKDLEDSDKPGPSNENGNPEPGHGKPVQGKPGPGKPGPGKPKPDESKPNPDSSELKPHPNGSHKPDPGLGQRRTPFGLDNFLENSNLFSKDFEE